MWGYWLLGVYIDENIFLSPFVVINIFIYSIKADELGQAVYKKG
jgi:hypothetical protein